MAIAAFTSPSTLTWAVSGTGVPDFLSLLFMFQVRSLGMVIKIQTRIPSAAKTTMILTTEMVYPPASAARSVANKIGRASCRERVCLYV